MAPKPNPVPLSRAVIGWQGFTLNVPDDWTIGAIGGDHAEGYLRIDGGDMVRAELKWFERKGPVSIQEVVGNFLKELSKRRSRKDPEIKSRRDTRLLGRRRSGRGQLECFYWTDGRRQAHGAAWQCTQCDRVSIVQVLGKATEGLDELARELLESVSDHSQNGWSTWATYGLRCEVPEEFRLSGQRLMAGLLELNFALESEKITVMRWGMADIVLGNEDLRAWAQKELAPRLKAWNTAYEELQYNGHSAIAVTGEPATLTPRLRKFIQHCLRKPYGSNVRALVWHCAPAKKLYYVECILDDSRLELPAEICERVPCHSAS